jgi:pullulanase/glycogen debranching enzyme
VPEGSYSTDPYQPETRIREFKQMVKALHDAGIRVILDVVYNHTYDIAHSNFQLTYPDYYYRKAADGKYSNGSGCGNETASDKPMMRRFMIESVKYWINEYHIDGFRFDLMGVHDIETMNQIRQAVDEIDRALARDVRIVLRQIHARLAAAVVPDGDAGLLAVKTIHNQTTHRVASVVNADGVTLACLHAFTP